MALRTFFLLGCGGALMALGGCAVAPPGSYVTGTTVYDGVAVTDPYGYGYGGYGYGGYGYGYGGLGYTGIYGGPAYYYGGAPGYYRRPWFGGPPRGAPAPVPAPGFGGPRPPVAPLANLPPPRFGGPPATAGPGFRAGPPARFVPRGGGRR